VVERFRIPGEYDAGAELPVVLRQSEGTGFLGLGRTKPQGRFDLWLCAACGFTELWAAELSGLREDPANGVRLIDASTAPAGPFR